MALATQQVLKSLAATAGPGLSRGLPASVGALAVTSQRLVPRLAPRGLRSPCPPGPFALAAPFGDQRRFFSFRALDSCSGTAPLPTRGRLSAAESVALRDVIAFLREHYGMHRMEVRKELVELAEILGYTQLSFDTRVRMSDAFILMEEVGVNGCSVREFRRFLRQQGRPETQELQGEDAAEVVRNLEEWLRLQNAKDLLAAARKAGASVETLPQGQGWLKVTIPGGTVLRYKQVGKKDRARGEGGHTKKPARNDKKVEIRACPDAEDPVTTRVLSAEHAPELLRSDPRYGSAPASESSVDYKRMLFKEKANPQAVTRRPLRERVSEPGKTPRRRGPIGCTMYKGRSRRA